MVTAVKGDSKILCTLGTFENKYQKLGYQLASQNGKGTTKKVAPHSNKGTNHFDNSGKNIDGWTDTETEGTESGHIDDIEIEKKEISDSYLKPKAGSKTKKGE